MARHWPADEIPDSSIAVPPGVYTVSCAMKEARTKDTDKLMFIGTFTVVEPATWAGAPIYENFVIGTDADVDADDPETWKASVAARIMKRVFKAAGLGLTEDLDELVVAIEGQQIAVEVGQEVDQKGKYAPKAKIVSWYPLGEREPGVAAPPVAAKPAVRRVAPAAPALANQAAPPATRPAAAVPRAATPQLTTRERMLKCGVCEQPVPQSRYGAHVAAHEE